MLESTVNAANPLDVIGSLAQSARDARRSQHTTSTGTLTNAVESANSSLAQAGVVAESMSDAGIVELVLRGDQNVFAILVERYKDAVQNLAYRMLGNATEAEDVTQEAFVRAYTQLVTYKPAHKFSTWLLSIASHLSIDQLRRRRFLALPLDDVPFLEWIVDAGVSPEQSALRGEQHDEVQTYLQRLPGKYRAVIVLRYWHDFSYDEIAHALNLTPALVKARLHRARELLARYMQNGQSGSVLEEEQNDALSRR